MLQPLQVSLALRPQFQQLCNSNSKGYRPHYFRSKYFVALFGWFCHIHRGTALGCVAHNPESQQQLSPKVKYPGKSLTIPVKTMSSWQNGFYNTATVSTSMRKASWCYTVEGILLSLGEDIKVQAKFPTRPRTSVPAFGVPHHHPHNTKPWKDFVLHYVAHKTHLTWLLLVVNAGHDFLLHLLPGVLQHAVHLRPLFSNQLTRFSFSCNHRLLKLRNSLALHLIDSLLWKFKDCCGLSI